MGLFQHGSFTLASGEQAKWKIECDALTYSDWQCIAELIRRKYNFSEVHGVPTGGCKLAALLEPHCVPYVKNSLIVDDVYTTGGSIRKMREELIMRPDGGGRCYLGCVVFARGRVNVADGWVTPLFQYHPLA